jgi:hypothetical protein
LRDHSPVPAPTRAGVRRPVWVGGAALAAAATASAIALWPGSQPRTLALRTATSRPVAHVTLSREQGDNQLVALEARGLPPAAGGAYGLWATNTKRGRLLVGRLLGDARGGCQASFTIPGGEGPGALAISPAGQATTTLAAT